MSVLCWDKKCNTNLDTYKIHMQNLKYIPRTQLYFVRKFGYGLALFFFIGGCQPIPTRSDTVIEELHTLKTDATALYDNFNSPSYAEPLQRVGADVSLLLDAENERPNNGGSYEQVRVIGVQISKDSAHRAAGPILPPHLEQEETKVLILIDSAILTENRKPIK
jgi:hypothetical protein